MNDSSTRILVKTRPGRHISKSSAKNSYSNDRQYIYPQQVNLTGNLQKKQRTLGRKKSHIKSQSSLHKG